MINCIHNKCVYLLCIYRHTCIYIYIYIYKNFFMFIYLNIYIYTHTKIHVNVYTLCVYLYIHNTYTHILCKQKRLFWIFDSTNVFKKTNIVKYNDLQ